MNWNLIDPPDGRPWALIAIAGSSLVLNLVLGAKLLSGPDAETVSEPVAAVTAPAEEAVEAVPADGEAVAEAAVDEVQDTDVRLPQAEHLDLSVSHSLARTFQNSGAEDPDVLSAWYARLFFWDLDLRRDLQAGDGVQMAYQRQGEDVVIHAATFTSLKHGRTFRAYQYQADGDPYTSWWDESGTEVPRRLVNGPLQGNYEQITSLLKDRPSHKGMDFKADVGTDVVSPKAGSVVRTDWNWKYNGNCVEVRYDDGTLAKFLHLSETSVSPGQRVAAGARLGATGNTGRSTAPHLHYELEKNGKVVYPVDYHGVSRRSLPEGDRVAFDALVEAWNTKLAGSGA